MTWLFMKLEEVLFKKTTKIPKTHALSHALFVIGHKFVNKYNILLLPITDLKSVDRKILPVQVRPQVPKG